MSGREKSKKQEIEAYKRRVMASFREFSKGKRNEDFFPESNKRALENLVKAGLLKP